MRRLLRILLNAATVLSLVLCVGMAGLLCSGRGDGDVVGLRIGRGLYLTVSGTEASLLRVTRIDGWGGFEASDPHVRVWFPGALMLFAPLPLLRGLAWWVRSGWRDDRAAAAGRCPACGYDLRATPDRCPECGRAADRA